MQEVYMNKKRKEKQKVYEKFANANFMEIDIFR